MDSKEEEATNTAEKSTILQTTTTRQKSSHVGILSATTKVPSGSPQHQALKDADHVVKDEAVRHQLDPTAFKPDQVSKEGELTSQNIDNELMSIASDLPSNATESLNGYALNDNAQTKDLSSSSVSINIVDDSPRKPNVVGQVPNAITPADSVTEDTRMGLDTTMKHLIHSNSHVGMVGNNEDSKKSFLPTVDISILDSQASRLNSSSNAENALLPPYISSSSLVYECETNKISERATQSEKVNHSDRENGSEGVEIPESLPNTENVSPHQVKRKEDSTLSSLMTTMDTNNVHKNEKGSSSEATLRREVLNFSSTSNTSPPLHTPTTDAPIDAQNVALPESIKSPIYTSLNQKIAKRFAGSAVRRVGESTESQNALVGARDGSRKPLTDLYGDYLCDATDTCLEDARCRLKTALSQTYMLQKAFTDRLYDKYRVCLRPPRTTDEVINTIYVDPISSDERLRNEIVVIRDEKEVERKEAVLLNAEMAASKITSSLLAGVDNAEQLMYYTAGLNLVILPEENVSDDQVRNYHDRGPTNPGTGQRVRNISQAAAVAGEVMLDRTRKAIVMRADRKRRRRVQFMPNDIQAHSINDTIKESKSLAISTAARRNEFATISLSQSKLSSKPTNKPSVSFPSFASTKFRSIDVTPSIQGTSISRNIPTNILHPALSLTESMITSLNANHDELMSEHSKPIASTAWLQQHSVRLLNNNKTADQHGNFYIKSQGGSLHHGLRQTQSSSGNSGLVFQSTLPSILKSSLRKNDHELPRRPTAEERRSSKPLVVSDFKKVLTERTRLSLESVFDSCGGTTAASTSSGSIPLKLKSQVGLLCNMQLNDEEITKRSNPQMGGIEKSKLFSTKFTFSVLHAVGLFQSTSTQARSNENDNSLNNKAWIPPFTFDINKLPWTDPVLKLTGQIEKSDRRVTKLMTERKFVSGNKDRNNLPIKSQMNFDELGNNPDHISDSKQKTNPRPFNFLSTEIGADDVAPSVKRMRSSSSPGQNFSTTERLHKLMNVSTNSQQPLKAAQENATMLPPGSSHVNHYSQRSHQVKPYDYRWSTAETTLFRNQLTAPNMHHPAAGDLARYLGNFHSRRNEYELFMPHGSQSQSLTMNTSDSLTHPIAGSNAVATQGHISREQHQARLNFGYSMHQSFNPSLVPQNFILQTFPNYQHPPWGNTNNNLYPLGTKTKTKTLKSEHNRMPISTKTQIQRGTELETSAAPHPTSGIACTNSYDDSGEYMTDCHQSVSSLQQQTQKRENGAAGVKIADTADKTCMNTNDLVLFTPKAPDRLPNKVAELIRLGKFHEALPLLNDYSETFLSLEYLMAVGAAVPIPKVMITILLKEHMTANTFRQYGMNSMSPIPREIITAAVSIWLWSNHENNFQQAFTKNGRVDVDRECKILVHHSLMIATKALSREIEESTANRTGVFAEAATARNCTDAERAFVMKSVELNIALTVSKALSEEMQYCQNIDIMLPNIHDAVALLDEARCVAFRVKAIERTLLASLLSKKVMIDSMFADAYVCSLIRSGEAYGHGDLFEIIQNEAAKASAMIPYDIFTDETGTWEDPNRPENGFASGINGQQLIRRAHARAVFQMSLKKLQIRNNIGGGAISFGPYEVAAQMNGTVRDNIFTERRTPLLPSPRPGLKRKISSILETRIPVGTGSAQAKSAVVYEPKHIVSSIELNSSSLPNSPYGMHSVIESRKRFSLENTTNAVHKKFKTDFDTTSDSNTSEAVAQSTHEVKWTDVISGFHLVKLPKKTSGSKNALPVPNQNALDRKIFAPVFRNVSGSDLIDDEDESDTEEDITESSVIHRHQIVLDKMRENLNKVTEERKNQQQLRKNVHGK